MTGARRRNHDNQRGNNSSAQAVREGSRDSNNREYGPNLKAAALRVWKWGRG